MLAWLKLALFVSGCLLASWIWFGEFGLLARSFLAVLISKGAKGGGAQCAGKRFENIAPPCERVAEIKQYGWHGKENVAKAPSKALLRRAFGRQRVERDKSCQQGGDGVIARGKRCAASQSVRGKCAKQSQCDG